MELKRFHLFRKGDTSYLEFNNGIMPNLTARCWKKGKLTPDDIYNFDINDASYILEQLVASPRTKI